MSVIRRSRVNVNAIAVPDDPAYLSLTQDILETPVVSRMKGYIQHGDTTCMEHCVNVSYLSYLFAEIMVSTPAVPPGPVCCTTCSCTTGTFTAAGRVSGFTASSTL